MEFYKSERPRRAMTSEMPVSARVDSGIAKITKDSGKDGDKVVNLDQINKALNDGTLVGKDKDLWTKVRDNFDKLDGNFQNNVAGDHLLNAGDITNGIDKGTLSLTA